MAGMAGQLAAAVAMPVEVMAVHNLPVGRLVAAGEQVPDAQAVVLAGGQNLRGAGSSWWEPAGPPCGAGSAGSRCRVNGGRADV